MGDSCELIPKQTLEMYVKAFMHHEEETITCHNGLTVWVGKNDQPDCNHFKVVVSFGPDHMIRRTMKPCFKDEPTADKWAEEIKRRFVEEFRARGVPAEYFLNGAWN